MFGKRCSFISSARVLFFVLTAALSLQTAGFAATDWLQWGGANRNFKSDAKGLASTWPEKGPKQLWSRTLGDGHSAILVEGNRLYTMYSKGDQEVAIALDAATGKTIWEYAYEVSPAGMNYEFGKGPHATPLIVGNHLYAAGATSKLHCLDKQNGKVVWSHDLWKEYNGTPDDRGYSCSPLAYKNTIIVTVGGKGQAIMAFNQKDGSVVWKKQDFMPSPNSHLIINVDGQDQLVAFLGDAITGLDPNNGELLWSHPHKTDWGLNISTPVWGEDNLLFVSSAYSGGSRVLKLTRKDGKTTASEVWFHRRFRLHHGNAIRIGDTAYGSSGDFGPAFICGVDVKTGNILFQDRSFPKSTFIYADNKLIILDEDGNLALATISPQGLKVISKASVFAGRAWTVPTLDGTKLYLRDRKIIQALDLSA
jgi:outer membrane protein assembly factor BamB